MARKEVVYKGNYIIKQAILSMHLRQGRNVLYEIELTCYSSGTVTFTVLNRKVLRLTSKRCLLLDTAILNRKRK